MFGMEKRRRPGSRADTSRQKLTTLERHTSKRWADLWFPLALTISVAIVVTVLIVSGQDRLSYRPGQRATQDLRLRVELQIPNKGLTRAKREERAAQARLAFFHNPQPLETIRDDIVELLTEVSKHPKLEEMDGVVQARWKLSPELFTKLREMVPTEIARARLTRQFDEALSGFVARGVLDQADLPIDESQLRAGKVEIWAPAATQPLYASLEDILSTTLTRPTGPLYARLEEKVGADPAKILFSLVVPGIRRTLTFDEARSTANRDRERSKVEEVLDTYRSGSTIVLGGQLIDENAYRLLEMEHAQLATHRTWWDWAERATWMLVLVGAVMGLAGIYLANFAPELMERRAQRFALPLTTLAVVIAGYGLSIEPYHAEELPLAVAAMILALVYPRPIALVLVLALSVLVVLMDVSPMSNFLVLFGGTTVAVLALDGVRSRTKLIAVGMVSAVALGVLSLATGYLADQPTSLVVIDSLKVAACGLIAGFLISGTLPFIESMLGIVTDISLLELADTSHPLLRDLIRRAPGTYNHSVTVSIIAEAAAKVVGANSLLVRVGALFHDVGKMLKPQYFIENHAADELNRHAQLAPAMSTLIIIGHVKDGVDLGRQHNLPQPIIELIEQHHGTTLVDYFYYEAAREQQEAIDPEETVEEARFRYPGPRPRSKEAAILMLCDCVESASRALSEPTPKRIEKLVRNLSLKRLLDHQFDESGLTFVELHHIEESLIKSMISVYHGRIKYPKTETA